MNLKQVVGIVVTVTVTLGARPAAPPIPLFLAVWVLRKVCLDRRDSAPGCMRQGSSWSSNLGWFGVNCRSSDNTQMS